MQLIRSLKDQLSLAEENLTETRNRYMQGLTDYLPVLTALHTLQGLERDLILSKRQLISFRILLYRAIGGSMTVPISQNSSSVAKFSSQPITHASTFRENMGTN